MHTLVDVNEEITVTNEKPFNFIFKCCIYHKGLSLNSGHYYAVVKVGDEYASCSDSDISFTDKNDLLKSAYFIICEWNT